nr:ATP synthase F0 subunit 6 [Crenidorsum sp.]
MLMSLFEVYDPFTFYGGLSLNWFVLCFVYFVFFSVYWLIPGIYYYLFDYLLLSLVREFSNFYSVVKLKVGLLVFICLFLYVLLCNILGLIPYVFACSSHFVFSISFGFPFWFGLMLLGWINFTNSMFSHLIPVGTPLVLISFMVLIETISNFIRPWSLSIRLMANMISGHLLMSLLGDCGFSVVIIQLGLFGFEFFVCFIQAYVFSALLTLYSSEI